jgi:hypothetical protein
MAVEKVKPAAWWIGRIINYNKQMFPLYPNQIALMGGFCANYFILALVLAPKKIDLLEMILGGLSYVLMTYVLRACDEIKDYASDHLNFPERPLVKGVLSHQDIYRLLIAIALVLFILQLPFLGRVVVPVFLVCAAFMFLMFKWFFMEKKIRASLPLALLSHNPIVYFFQFYLLSFFISPNNFPIAAALFLLGDGMIATAWEIARKIRGTEEEDSYTTYSKIWGIYWPPLLVIALIAGSFLLTLSPMVEADFILLEKLMALWSVPFVLFLGLVFFAIKFYFDPTKAPKFRIIVEAYKIVIIVVSLAAMVLRG